MAGGSTLSSTLEPTVLERPRALSTPDRSAWPAECAELRDSLVEDHQQDDHCEHDDLGQADHAPKRRPPGNRRMNRVRR